MPDTLRIDNYTEAWVNGNVRTYMWLAHRYDSGDVCVDCARRDNRLHLQQTALQRQRMAVHLCRGRHVFPPQIVLIPLFRLFNTIGLYDTLYPMMIVHTAFGLPICTLLMRNFFSTVPAALREAAIIDGASEPQILFRVMLPLSLPATAVLATLQFTWIWNDFLWPLIFTQSDNMDDDHGRSGHAQGTVQRRLGRTGRDVRDRQHPHADDLRLSSATSFAG